MRKGHTTLHTLALQGGMRPIQRVALDWVKQGKTPLEEVERVLGQIVDEEEAKQSVGPTRVLLVDDDEEVRYMLEELLLREGFEVTVVDDGKRALDVLKADADYSLMILDLGMPRLDGRQVLDQVRGWVDTAALPVIVWTGSGVGGPGRASPPGSRSGRLHPQRRAPGPPDGTDQGRAPPVGDVAVPCARTLPGPSNAQTADSDSFRNTPVEVR